MNKEQQIELLKSVEEKSLPDYALKLLNGEEMTEEETANCERFCKAVSGIKKGTYP